jgi:hypothetical protein
MAAPGFFVLLAGILLLLFAACMLTGAVWLFFGWRKKSRSVQFLSALPFGVGLLIIGPLLLLALIMVGLWLIADWRSIPPPSQEQKPNQRTSGMVQSLAGFILNVSCAPCLSASVRPHQREGCQVGLSDHNRAAKFEAARRL